MHGTQTYTQAKHHNKEKNRKFIYLLLLCVCVCVSMMGAWVMAWHTCGGQRLSPSMFGWVPGAEFRVIRLL